MIKRTQVFLEIVQRSLGFRQRMAIDFYSIQFFIFLRILFSFWTNYRNFSTCFMKRCRFLPHTSIKRDREIFNNDTDFLACQFLRLFHTRLPAKAFVVRQGFYRLIFHSHQVQEMDFGILTDKFWNFRISNSDNDKRRRFYDIFDIIYKKWQ